MPWGHHVAILDKCKGDCGKALFYVRRTIQNGWSRNVLLNWLATDLYEREGRAQTNFVRTMPSDACDLAQQLVKDPQIFEVFGLREQHDEAELKLAIVANIERTLLSLGRGVAFLGREYPVEIGGETKTILKDSACRWESRTTKSRRFCRHRRSLPSAMKMPKCRSPADVCTMCDRGAPGRSVFW